MILRFMITEEIRTSDVDGGLQQPISDVGYFQVYPSLSHTAVCRREQVQDV